MWLTSTVQDNQAAHPGILSVASICPQSGTLQLVPKVHQMTAGVLFREQSDLACGSLSGPRMRDDVKHHPAVLWVPSPIQWSQQRAPARRGIISASMANPCRPLPLRMPSSLQTPMMPHLQQHLELFRLDIPTNSEEKSLPINAGRAGSGGIVCATKESDGGCSTPNHVPLVPLACLSITST